MRSQMDAGGLLLVVGGLVVMLGRDWANVANPRNIDHEINAFNRQFHNV